MYYCEDCGAEFSLPKTFYESHGFTSPPYESVTVCPFCNSSSFKEIVSHCRCCGAKLSLKRFGEYCSAACKAKGEKLWQKQRNRLIYELNNPINRMIREINNYNKINGTDLSYGQYVALKFINRGKSKCLKKKKNT